VNEIDKLLGDPGELKQIHESLGVKPLSESVRAIPLIEQDSLNILDLAEAKLHQKQLAELQKFLLLVEEPQDINEITALPILAKLSYGYRKSGEYMALAGFQYNEKKAARKRAEAVAFLDNFREYAANKKAAGVADFKATDDAKKHYVNLDPEVSAASKEEALFQAMYEQLKTIQMEFLMAISTAKAAAYGFKKSNMMSGASTAVTGEE